MPAIVFYTRAAANTKAAAIKTALALSKLRLVKSSLVPNVNTTKAQLVAAEADFSGYTAGGYVLTAWTGPVNNAGSGAIITPPAVNPAYVEPDPGPGVANAIGAWWVEDAAGNVRLVGTFADPISLGQNGDGFTWLTQVVEGYNPPVEF
jgi:hypothetical protein